MAPNYTVRQMNGRPIGYGSFVDAGQRDPGRRRLVGRHTSIDAAVGAIARQLEPAYAGIWPGRTWWVAEIDSSERRGDYSADWARRRIVAGPFDASLRPSRLFRLGA